MVTTRDATSSVYNLLFRAPRVYSCKLIILTVLHSIIYEIDVDTMFVLLVAFNRNSSSCKTYSLKKSYRIIGFQLLDC